jgi:thiamine transport system permease protein
MFKQSEHKLIDIGFGTVLVFFAAFIFIPAIYILKGFSGLTAVADPLVLRAVLLSFFIGLTVTFVNLIFGVPLAWVLTRSKKRIARWVDNLVDLSLVMPTAALGFSVYLFWGSDMGLSRLFGLEGGLFSKGPLMIGLLHIVFTLPYMIRSVSAAISQIDPSYEEASASLGASPFTFFRTVALPLFRNGVINGSVLSFTRSLSETGATMMVAGAAATAPVLIISLKNAGKMSEAAGASIILIAAAILMLVLARFIFGKKVINLNGIYPRFERKLSGQVRLKNTFIFSFYGLFIFLPTVYIALYYIFNFRLTNINLLLGSILISFGVALAVTLVNLLFSLPLSYMIARDKFRLGGILTSLNEAVLLMPTSALGLSIALYWRNFFSSDILLLLLVHLCFSFPYLVKPITAAMQEVSESQQEAAYSLGASTRQMFFTILLPQIKPAIISGAIMAFMRSLSETGATLAVTGKIKTVSVMIVDLFKAERFDEAAIACVILFVVALCFLYILKRNQKVIR